MISLAGWEFSDVSLNRTTEDTKLPQSRSFETQKS